MNTVQQLQQEIQKLEKQVELIQNQCNHPEAARIKQPGANTGNYDPSADSYWVKHECGLCKKKWTVYN